MIDITQLLSDNPISNHSIRYSKKCKESIYGVQKNIGPVIVWNITRQCNYSCLHCYSNALFNNENDLISTIGAKKIIDDLKSINVPVILFSGGEPLIRKDIFELIEYAITQGIKVSISSNGSLISKEIALRLKSLNVNYIGISLDGSKTIHDKFRNKLGSYDEVIRGIENCIEVEQKVGLRFTLQNDNITEIQSILDLSDRMCINRICFYHLVPSGRGQEITNFLPTYQDTRSAIDLLYNYALNPINKNKEILTVDNHTDGVYLYLKTKKKNPKKAESIYELLKRNGGNRSGMAIACIDWNGIVHPDQFSMWWNIGDIKKEPFSQIWTSQTNDLHLLRNRKELLQGRCHSCKWIDICNGNLRARGYSVSGNIWQEDPGCYLNNSEISDE